MKKIVFLLALIVVLIGCTVTKMTITHDGQQIDYNKSRKVRHNIGLSFNYPGFQAWIYSDNIEIADVLGLPVNLDKIVSSGDKIILHDLKQGRYVIEVQLFPIQQYEKLMSWEEKRLKGIIKFEVGPEPERDLILFSGEMVQRILKIENSIFFKNNEIYAPKSLEELSNDYEIYMERLRRKGGLP